MFAVMGLFRGDVGERGDFVENGFFAVAISQACSDGMFDLLLGRCAHARLLPD
jgi:hypothetical protein